MYMKHSHMSTWLMLQSHRCASHAHWSIHCNMFLSSFQLGDPSLLALSSHCAHLSRLDVNHNYHLTDVGIRQLGNGAKRLKYIDVEGELSTWRDKVSHVRGDDDWVLSPLFTIFMISFIPCSVVRVLSCSSCKFEYPSNRVRNQRLNGVECISIVCAS